MRRRRRGEIAIRFATWAAKLTGDRELHAQLKEILADDDMRAMLGAALERIPQHTGGGDFLRAILDWIAANPELFKELVAWVLAMFLADEVIDV